MSGLWLVWVSLGASFSLVALMSSLYNFVHESGHFFHLYVAHGSFLQLVYATRGVLHRLSMNLPNRKARSMECDETEWSNLSMNFLRDSSFACHKLSKAAEVMRWDRLCIAHWSIRRGCRSCLWILVGVHHTRSMAPPWGMLERHDIGSQHHSCKYM